MIRYFDDDLRDSNKFPNSEWERMIDKCYNGCKFNWKNDLSSQIDFGSDLLITTTNGRRYSVDVKTKNHSYYNNKNYTLEIVHHIYSNKEKQYKLQTKPGWLYKSTSDLIAFGTKNKNELIELCLFSIYPFKDKGYSKILQCLPSVWSDTLFSNGTYQITINKLIHLDMISNSANIFFYLK